ncbi:thiopurine S-methyltransferase [Alteromonas lipolytica]|uniref:Thiopurine S-methyltransferase n=1 Tax=Alteromonas lipolytica TaxID=1856405 RepID=A0A1E8FAR5_9ALTE|nr:thiopurine S-methyltransferase [Alteromonas lipolytica]OFI32999.1 hypothetical protein BFC17_01625 [Alteromonas lipolytica]GGF63438.1 thiopurine S-methyltransferase [Alteromonas lipolytica]
MEHTFWHDKWEKGEIGFHQSDIHPMLLKFADQLGLNEPCRVFVPLCGKSNDMTFLLERGCEVVGIELSKLAVTQYFEGLGVTPTIETCGHLERYSAPDITLYCGDFFALTPEQLGSVDVVYDRAALVALPEDMRAQYGQRICGLAPRARQLLITFEYDQSAIAGPPFAISTLEIEHHYGKYCDIEMLASESLEGGLKGKVPALEKAWLLKGLG